MHALFLMLITYICNRINDIQLQTIEFNKKSHR